MTPLEIVAVENLRAWSTAPVLFTDASTAYLPVNWFCFSADLRTRKAYTSPGSVLSCAVTLNLVTVAPCGRVTAPRRLPAASWRVPWNSWPVWDGTELPQTGDTPPLCVEDVSATSAGAAIVSVPAVAPVAEPCDSSSHATRPAVIAARPMTVRMRMKPPPFPGY